MTFKDEAQLGRLCTCWGAAQLHRITSYLGPQLGATVHSHLCSLKTQRPALLCRPTAAQLPKPTRTSKCPWAVHRAQQGCGRKASGRGSSLQGSGNGQLTKDHLCYRRSVHFKSLSSPAFQFPFWKQGQEALTSTWRLFWGTRRRAKHSWKWASTKTRNKHHASGETADGAPVQAEKYPLILLFNAVWEMLADTIKQEKKKEATETLEKKTRLSFPADVMVSFL